MSELVMERIAENLTRLRLSRMQQRVQKMSHKRLRAKTTATWASWIGFCRKR